MSRRTPQNFGVTTETLSTSNRVTLVLHGEFDGSVVETFDAAAANVTTLSPDHVVVDLEGVTMMDSAAIGAIMRLRKQTHEDGRSFGAFAPRPFQQRLFAITGLAHILTRDEGE